MKKAFKIILVILVAPIILMTLIGFVGGLNQVTYHIDPKRAIKSYRGDLSTAFLFLQPPTSSDKLIRIVDSCPIDDGLKAYTVTFGSSEEELGMCICRTKISAGREWYKSESYVHMFDNRNKASIEVGENTYNFERLDKESADKKQLSNDEYLLSGIDGETVIIKKADISKN